MSMHWNRVASRSLGLGAALFASSLLFGCPPAGDGGKDAGPENNCDNADPCKDSRDCAGGFCDVAAGESVGCCVQVVCFGNDDCADGKLCDIRRGICIPDNLCNPGDNSGCPADQLCVYQDGAPNCVDAPAPAAYCAVAAGGRQIDDGSGTLFPAVTSAGGTLKLEATAYADGGKLIAQAQFTWTGDGVSSDGVLTGACAGPAVCDVTVTAHVGDVTCDGVVSVYPAPTGGTSRITVLDLGSGEPLVGVPVAASINGTPVGDVTGADGSHEFTGTASSISTFPGTHQWHTIIGPGNDTIIYTARLADTSKVAGVKGAFDFDHVSTQGDIKLGLAGTAIGSAITDLDFATIIGEIADYNVELEGVTDPGGQVVPLPSGLVIELGSEPIKGDYVTFGTPGPNMAWAIGGKVRLSEVGPIISRVTGSDDINVGGILGAVLPFFARFDHAIITDLGNLDESARPEAPADGTPVPFASWDFPEKTLTPNTLLSQSANYNMPDLPCTPGGGVTPACTLPAGAAEGASPFATGAVLLAGTIVPGYGLIPLGLTAGLDDFDSDDGDDFDGKLTSDPEATGAPDDGQAILDYAPPHDGLEGNLLVTVAIALDINNIAGDTAGFGASISTHVTKAYGGGQNTFPSGKFLESQGGTFSSTAGTFALDGVGDADFYRVNFDDGEDLEWNVWFSDPDTVVDVADLHPSNIDVSARVQHADVQAFKLGTGYENTGAPTPADFGDLFTFNGTNLDNLLYYLGGWSSEACKPNLRKLDDSVVVAHCSDVNAPEVVEEP